MNTYFNAFVYYLTRIFKEMGMNTTAFIGLDYAEYTLAEPYIENEFSNTARNVFNNWFFYGTKFANLYNSASLGTQKILLFEIIYYLMQCITRTSPFDCAYMLMEMGGKVENPYKARMLLIALDEAEEKNRCA